MELSVDTDSLRNNVVPNLQKVNGFIEDAYNTLNTLTAPTGYTQKTVINGFRNELNDIYDNLVDFRENVIETCENFEVAEDNNVSIWESLADIGNGLMTFLFGNQAEAGLDDSGNWLTDLWDEFTDWTNSYISSSEFIQGALDWWSDFIIDAEETATALYADALMCMYAIDEGVIAFGETAVDTAINFVGFVGSLGTGLYDLITGSDVTSNWTAAIDNITSYDATEAIMDEVYSNSNFSYAWANTYADPAFKRDGVVYGGVVTVTEVATLVAIAWMTYGARCRISHGRVN